MSERVEQPVVLRGGRVVDPESGFDGVADVLVRGGSVAAIGVDLALPPGATVVDVGGLVVGPGMIDLHCHEQTAAGHRLKALDGVTTALELEAGAMPVATAYERAAAEGRPLNYGFSAAWGSARALALLDRSPDGTVAGSLAVLGDAAWRRDASPRELTALLQLLAGELADGALGIGLLVGYAPRSDPREYLAVARLAAEAGVPTFTHARELVEDDPQTPVDGAEELVRAAAETGARTHLCHVNSTSRRHVARVLAALDRGRAAGLPLTTEAYPYGSGCTSVGAAFLAPERLEAWGLAPSALVMAGSGERVADAARLRELRAEQPGTLCFVEFLDEDDPADRELLLTPLRHRDVIVASDATPIDWGGSAAPGDAAADGGAPAANGAWPLPLDGATHPRTAGTFAKALRLMVRESGAWSWVEAFRRTALLPAQLLEQTAPAARAKGRLRAGADADLVVLDPATIGDAASYRERTRPSTGVRHLLVGGRFVVRDGALDPAALPGRPLRGAPR
ncbi:amidohydrolase family protein [Conexibacter stalactiti]|uniref:Amidohydrolase family protein n=1 Tax=Conexibacter stalactiti TaxID=1940611 RepID=A0ABU4HVQ5_9ACTN|nr:amidohydrolase family protein [Conexibacter stalactiti]MDW5597407.1 amidohydrolase family protein [Conexibacter stalactiti]MEC5038049.1 amidohydrolase family protein [Conexibacter stalactiti]